jgi:DNA-binding MarR family transcriptional regulator
MNIQTSPTIDQIARSLATLRRGPRVQRLHRVLTTRAGVDLDRPSFTVLAALMASGPSRVTELAESCAVDNSTMSRLVSRLTCNGLVEQTPSPTDRRVVIVSLTTEGEQMARHLLDVRSALLADVLADWSAEDQATFATLLDRFVTDLEQFNQAAVARTGALNQE